MVHIIASLGVFFAFLITSTAWVMVKIGGYVAAALALVVGAAMIVHRLGRRRKDGRRKP
jgi:flagellar biogenesis protein FliO